MESFIHLRKGKTPRRLHADLGGLRDDELGRGGFTGRTANLYRRHDPTAYRSEGPLRPVDVLSSELKPSDATDAHGRPLLMFTNQDCRISLSRRDQPMPFYARHVDGELLCFVHQGTGLLETEFGPLRYRDGDWVYLPKACTWRQVPDAATTMLMIEAGDEFRVPSPGQLGRHFPFDPSQVVIPEPSPSDADPRAAGHDEYEVRLVHDGGPTTLYYQHNPLDVEGWRGDNFAFTFNIADYNVITSDSVHLPPTVQLFMQANGVYVMNFLPKPAEGVEDLGAAIKDAKDRLGYQKVVLAGWSGGGSLSVFYQQQAQHATITSSPSGDGPDLTKLHLPAADGIMLLAAHISRHGTLTEWLDGSILDESDPTKRDPELDLYNPDNPNQPPYREEFLARYRQAQIGRNRRITGWVKEKLAELRSSERPGSDVAEFGFVVHGTMADPRWLDPTVDPNERAPGACYLGDPQVVNMSPVGLARFSTLRSLLSQWSYDDAHGDGVDCGRDIAVPALVIGNLADDACTPSHTRRLFEAIAHPDKEMHEIHGSTHYYAGPDQRAQLREAVTVVTDWRVRHKFVGTV